MLDEAQLVAATSSVAAQMTSSLWRRHAWVVTGTPITSRLGEIQVCLWPDFSTCELHSCLGMCCHSCPDDSIPVATPCLGGDWHAHHLTPE